MPPAARHDPGPAFRALHAPGDPFVLANAWDVGSARMLAAMGARALATSSAAHAFTLGRPDGTVARDEALAHAQTLVAATPLPVSGDFEDGWADGPDGVAETVRLAGEIGVAGLSIEDVHDGGTPYDREEAVERVRAGVAAARALPRDVVFCARADGVMEGAYDLTEGIARLRTFEAAGADCLYLPLPPDMDGLRRVTASVSAPVNALAAGPFTSASLAEFAAAGVARVSLGSALARATHRLIADAGAAMFERGDFTPLACSIAGADVDAKLARGAQPDGSETFDAGR